MNKEINRSAISILGLVVMAALAVGSMDGSPSSPPAPTPSPTPSPEAPEQLVDWSDPATQERARRGEQIYNKANAKYQQPIGFTWRAREVSLFISESDWNKLSKEDQINVSLYAESLVSAVRSNPRNYVDRWKQVTELDGLSYEAFVEAVSRLCDQCWEVHLGKPVKDKGRWDMISEGPAVNGQNAKQFRQLASSPTKTAPNASSGGEGEEHVDEVIAGVVIKRYLSNTLHDPSSLQDFQVISITRTGKAKNAFRVVVFFRAKNALGALVGSQQTFLMTRGTQHWTGWSVTPVKR